MSINHSYQYTVRRDIERDAAASERPIAYNQRMRAHLNIKRIGLLLASCLAVFALAFATGCGQDASPDASPHAVSSSSQSGTASDSQKPGKAAIEEDGSYTSKADVALYIHTYGHLPDNFISKGKARKAGWISSEGNLDEVCPGKSIGGSQFHNDEGLLPDRKGRTWTECDINYHGGFRGGERIVFSNDGLIFYTDDHYETFEQLY